MPSQRRALGAFCTVISRSFFCILPSLLSPLLFYFALHSVSGNMNFGLTSATTLTEPSQNADSFHDFFYRAPLTYHGCWLLVVKLLSFTGAQSLLTLDTMLILCFKTSKEFAKMGHSKILEAVTSSGCTSSNTDTIVVSEWQCEGSRCVRCISLLCVAHVAHCFY